MSNLRGQCQELRSLRKLGRLALVNFEMTGRSVNEAESPLLVWCGALPKVKSDSGRCGVENCAWRSPESITSKRIECNHWRVMNG